MSEKKLYVEDETLTNIQQYIDTSNEIIVLIISTLWNRPYVQKLVDGITNKLNEFNKLQNITIKEIKVPGSWEIPIIVKKCVEKCYSTTTTVIITVGVLIKGDTAHFDLISQSVFQSLMDIQCNMTDKYSHVPIINGILTVNNEEQIEERIPLSSNWAISGLQMLAEMSTLI